MMKILTVGVSGASCSGKTTIASRLEKMLPHCCVINQDTYYHEESSDCHIRKGNHINWEVLEAFNMDKMHSDIAAAKKNMLTSATSSRQSLPDEVVPKNTIPVLIVEGIVIFRDPEILEQCDMKYFIEIDRDNCQQKRASRVWDPEESCWEEDPDYFNDIAWPEYRDCVGEMKMMEGIKFLDSSTHSIEHNFEIIISDIMKRIKLA